MSESLFDSQDDGEPPSRGEISQSNRQLGDILEKLDGDLWYTQFNSRSGDSTVTVDGYNLEVTGYLGSSELTSLESIHTHDDTAQLCRRISQSMAMTALRFGGPQSEDSEWDYPVFVSPSSDGEIYFMFRDEVKTGMITTRRENQNSLFRIESKNIRDSYEQKVLLGGLATLLAALEEG